MTGLRIISGSAKGRRLKDVPGDSTRPITDMVKEALFNILGLDILNAQIWDMFGGTGSVGLEALSRGASFVQFTDNNRNAINTLKANVTTTGFTTASTILFADAYTLLRQSPRQSFDYIYIAPPQYKGMWLEALTLLDQHINHLVSDGWAIIQIHPKEYEEAKLDHLTLIEERKYGNTLLLFYERKPSTGDS